MNSKPTYQELEYQIAELKMQNEAILLKAEIQNQEKENRAAELFIANKELAFQNQEKENRAAELIIANKELVFQNKEKENHAAELCLSTLTLKHQATIIEERKQTEKLLQDQNEEIIVQNEELRQIIDELRISAQNVLETENKFQTITDLSLDGITLTTMDGRFVFVNQMFCKMTGYSVGELLKMKIYDMKPPWQPIIFFNNKVKMAGKYFQTSIIRKNSSELFVEMVGSIIKIEDKEFVLGTVRDITERKQAEEKITQYTDRLEEAEALAGLGSWELDVKTGQSWWSKQMYKMNGCENSVNSPSIELFLSNVHPEDRLSVEEAFTNASQGKFPKAYEFRSHPANGPVRYFFPSILAEKNILGEVLKFKGTQLDITDRKQAEEKITQYTNRLEEAEALAGLGSWEFDVKTGQPWWSKQMYKMNGFAVSDIIPEMELFIANIHHDDRKYMHETISNLVKGKLPEDCEFRSNPANSEVRYFFPTVKAEKNILGEVLKFKGTQLDITERKLVEKALQASQDIFSKAFHSSPSAMVIARYVDGLYIEANESFLKLTELTREEVIGKNTNALNLNNVDEILKIRRLLTERKPLKNYEVQAKTKYGKLLNVLISVEYIHLVDEDCTITTVLDITDRKKAENALSESEKRFSKIFDSSPVGISLSEPETGLLINVNNSFAAIWGYSREDVIGKRSTDFDLWGENDEREKIVVELKKQGNIKNRIFSSYKKTGEKIKTQLSMEVIELSGKKYLLSNVEDVTERINIANEIKLLTENLENKVIKRTAELAETNLQLKQSSARLELATRAGGVGVWDYDIVNNIIVWDDQMYVLYGLTKENFGGAYEAWQSGLHPEDLEKGDVEIQKAISGEKEFDIEFRVVWGDGSIHHIRGLAKTFRDETGKALNMIGTNWDITEQKNAEKLLNESNEKLSSFIKNSPVYTFIKQVTPTESKVLVVSDNFVEMVGISSAEMVNKTMFELFPPELAAQMTADDWNVVSGGKIFTIDEDFNGRNYTSIKFPLIFSNYSLLAGYTIDITSRKQAEQALKENNERLEMTMDAAQMAWWIMEMPSGNISFSRRKADMLDFPPEQFKHYTDFMKLVHPDDEKRVLDNMSSHFARTTDKYEVEYRILSKSGEYKWFFDTGTVSKRDSDGNPLKVNGLIMDISKRKYTEQALKESEEKFRLMINNSNDTFVLINENAELFFISDASFQATGFTPEETVGSFAKLIHPDDIAIVSEIWAKILSNKESLHQVQYRHIHKQKGYVWLEAVAQNFLDNPAIKAVVANVRDITERKQAEEGLKNAKNIAEDANRMKSEFLANMSHEIRTPLNAIVGFSSILKEKSEGNKTFTEYLGNIIQSSKVLLNLINDILDLSKVEAGRMVIDHQPVNLNTLITEIQSVFELKATEKGISIEIDFADNIPGSLITDEKFLRQILFNLIGNAVKFTHDGNVKIKVNLIPKKEDGSTVDLVIMVKDSGIGIPEGELINIFEPFRQVSQKGKNIYGGTGLGLSITRRLTELLGGTISAESEYGKGSVFTVSFFDIEIGALNNLMGNNLDKSYLKNIRFKNPILVMAEDVLSNRQVIKGYLETFNITIIETENGEDCVTAVHKHHPDIILMDMQMPVMDGFTAINILKTDSEFKTVPIIALTASGMKHEKDRIGEVADDLLLKPVYKYDLLELLAKYLPYDQINEIEDTNIQNVNDLASKSIPDEMSVDLKTNLARILLPDIVKLQVTLNIDDIKIFTTKMEDLWEKNPNNQIANFLEQLTDYANSFNIGKIATTLKKLAEFLN